MNEFVMIFTEIKNPGTLGYILVIERWIGAQFPQEKFLSYGRIFTLHYYFLLMCILFSSFYWLSTGFS